MNFAWCLKTNKNNTYRTKFGMWISLAIVWEFRVNFVWFSHGFRVDFGCRRDVNSLKIRGPKGCKFTRNSGTGVTQIHWRFEGRSWARRADFMVAFEIKMASCCCDSLLRPHTTTTPTSHELQIHTGRCSIHSICEPTTRQNKFVGLRYLLKSNTSQAIA